MEKIIRKEITDDKGVKQYCQLKEKVNNQNGGMLYTFLNETNQNSFTITKDEHKWTLVNGNLPTKNTVEEIGDYLDSLEE